MVLQYLNHLEILGSNEEKKASTLNARAMNALFCALNEVEYNRVSLCTSAKDIWILLQVTHEGTNQVKESKIGALTQKYELFKMLEDEDISKMFTRFNDIIVQLQGLGKPIPSSELNRKFLQALPWEWRPKVTAIEEAKDLKTLPLEELLGSLITHEQTLLNDKEDKGTSKKKKDLALRILQELEVSDDDNEIALLTNKFKRFLRNKGALKRGGDKER